jgi:hypothetical protein
MDGAAALHQALAGETFLEKERRLSEMIRQLQMVREQLLSQQELHGKVGKGISLPNIQKGFRALNDINRRSARKHYTLRDFCRLAIEPVESFGAYFFLRTVWSASSSPRSGGSLRKLCISSTIKSNLYIFVD